MDWIISVGGYGSFFFEGSESEAEEMRKHKAVWEQGAGRKRLATDEEVRTKIIDDCKNHSGFNSTTKFICKCPKCELIERRLKINKLKLKNYESKNV